LAHQIIEFKTEKTKMSDSITGQINLPDGVAKKWSKDVIIFIHPMFFSNRDSWLVDGQDSSPSYRKVMGLLDEALSKNNMAVVRFDNPGVSPPSMQCREKIKLSGISETILKKRCFDEEVLSNLTHEQYLADIETLILDVKIRLPLAKERIILMGFSEGGVHIAHLINRLKIRPRGIVMLGSPLESMKTLTKWQSTQRLMDTIQEFDLNGDGVATNDEIEAAYKNGVGKYMFDLKSWLSPYQQWDKNNIQEFEKTINNDYETRLNKILRIPKNRLTLYLNKLDSGAIVPQYTSAFDRLHYLDELSSFDILIKSKIPSLIIFGGKDKQVRVDEQLRLAQEARLQGAKIQELVFKDRYHGLSIEKDPQMFSSEMIPELSEAISTFAKGL
jgi:pimeloyl-ACP methyl ester carboxylesterase